MPGIDRAKITALQIGCKRYNPWQPLSLVRAPHIPTVCSLLLPVHESYIFAGQIVQVQALNYFMNLQNEFQNYVSNRYLQVVIASINLCFVAFQTFSFVLNTKIIYYKCNNFHVTYRIVCIHFVMITLSVHKQRNITDNKHNTNVNI